MGRHLFLSRPIRHRFHEVAQVRVQRQKLISRKTRLKISLLSNCDFGYKIALFHEYFSQQDSTVFNSHSNIIFLNNRCITKWEFRSKLRGRFVKTKIRVPPVSSVFTNWPPVTRTMCASVLARAYNAYRVEGKYSTLRKAFISAPCIV